LSKNLTYLPPYLRLDPENLCVLGTPHRLLKTPLLLPSRLGFGSPKALCCGQAKNEEGRKASTSRPKKPDGKQPPALAADQTRSAALASPGPHSGRNPIPRDSHREVPFGVLPTVFFSSSNQHAAEKKVSASAKEARHLTPPTHRHSRRIPGSSGILSLVGFRFLARCCIDSRFHITNRPRALFIFLSSK
jgi:hypothetical protein